MYQQRLQKARQGDRIAEERYQREVDQIRAATNSEIKARSQGYQEALSLLNRELVLDGLARNFYFTKVFASPDERPTDLHLRTIHFGT